VFLTYGYDYINEQCYPGNRCDLMLPNGIHHRYCIRNNPEQPAEQIRIEDPLLRSRIPRGVYRHFRTMRSQPVQQQTASGTTSVESVEDIDCDMECDDADDTCDLYDDPDISICGMDSI
jgi:hypothetical protein